jgi:predicted transcriptional regulator
MYLQNKENKKEPVSAENQKQKTKQKKKKGKVAQVYAMHQKGVSVKEIAEKMKLSQQIVRSYIWRAKNPQKYKKLLNRYFAKRKQKAENEKIKALVQKQKQESKEKEKVEKQ